MKLSLRLLVPTLAVVLAAGAAALLFTPSIQAQTPENCDTATTICVTDVEFTSTGPYMVGDTIAVTFTFTDGIVDDDLTDTSTTTTATFSMFDPSNDGSDPTNDPATTTLNFIASLPQESSTQLVFTYTVVEGDPHGGVVTVAESAVTAVVLTDLEDAGATTRFIDNDHDRLSAYDVPGHLIDKVAPTITDVAITRGSTQGTGGTVSAKVTFDEAVNAQSSSMLAFMIGDAGRSASYSSGSGTTMLTFTYSIVKGDNGAPSIPASSTSTPSISGGSVTDLAGNPAVLSHAAASASEDHGVATDVVAPSVSYKAPNSLTVGIRIRTIKPRTDDTDIARYEITDGRLPRTLRFNTETGEITGRPTRSTSGPTRLTITVYDTETPPNETEVQLTLPAIDEDEEETVVDQTPTLPEVPEVDLSTVTVGDAAPSTGLQIALAATGAALLLGGIGMVAVRRQRVRTRR